MSIDGGLDMNKEIQIFVSNRIDLESKKINNPLFVPIRCGAVFDKRENIKTLGDDTGENISEKRESYCELTVLYWMWKNAKADYIGLSHYRRFLSFSDKVIPGADSRIGLLDNMSDINLKKAGLLDVDKMANIIKKYDLIVAPMYHMKKEWLPQNTEKNIRDSWLKYCKNFLTKKSFDLMIQCIKDKYPEYYDDAIEFMENKYFLGYNCCIGKREIINKLCEFLFGVLFECEKKINENSRYYSVTNKRACGYMGEWLYSIWVYHAYKEKKYKIKENQLIAFLDTTPENELLPANGNSIPVIFFATSGNLMDISVTLQSFVSSRNPNDSYEIIVILGSNGESGETQFLINEQKKLLKHYIEQFENITFRFYDPKEKIGKYELRDWNKISYKYNYYLILLPWILEKYNKVLILSSNLLIETDIKSLFELDLNGQCIGGVRNLYVIGNENKNYENYEEMDKLINTIDIDVLVLDLKKLRFKYSKDEVSSLIDIQNNENFVLQNFNRIYKNEFYFIDYSWNYLAVQDFYFNKLLIDNVPYDFYQKYQNVKEKHIINLRVEKGVTLFFESDLYIKFWNFAKETPFYEILLKNRITGISVSILEMRSRKVSFARKVADKLLPHETRRREIVKKIIPKDSIQWRILKKIYHTIALD